MTYKIKNVSSQNSKITDRGWMIVQGEGNRFVTQRQEPLLAQIIPHIDEEKVRGWMVERLEEGGGIEKVEGV